MPNESTSRFQTNDPRGANGLPSDRIVVIRMKVKEAYTSGTPAVSTNVYRCRTWNGQVESKQDYLVYSKSGAAVNDVIFATRPIGGTGKIQATKIVDWIEVFIGAGPAGKGRKWDVWTTLDDAGAVGWTRPRFTNL